MGPRVVSLAAVSPGVLLIPSVCFRALSPKAGVLIQRERVGGREGEGEEERKR